MVNKWKLIAQDVDLHMAAGVTRQDPRIDYRVSMMKGSKEAIRGTPFLPVKNFGVDGIKKNEF